MPRRAWGYGWHASLPASLPARPPARLHKMPACVRRGWLLSGQQRPSGSRASSVGGTPALLSCTAGHRHKHPSLACARQRYSSPTEHHFPVHLRRHIKMRRLQRAQEKCQLCTQKHRRVRNVGRCLPTSSHEVNWRRQLTRVLQGGDSGNDRKAQQQGVGTGPRERQSLRSQCALFE